MLVPIALMLVVLLAAIIGGLYKAKRRVVDRDRPPDIRPDDHQPTANVRIS
jgi:hypothetical protein